jgi:hypothetical protein
MVDGGQVPKAALLGAADPPLRRRTDAPTLVLHWLVALLLLVSLATGVLIAGGQGLVVFYGMAKPVRTPLIGPRVRGGAAKQATSGPVQATTDQACPKSVPPEAQQCASYW